MIQLFEKKAIIMKDSEDEDKKRLGCAMVFFKFDKLKEIQDKIEKDDVYDDETEDYGLENEPHTTLLYGLYVDEVDKQEVFDIISEYEIGDLELFNVSSFKNEKYDVLKFETRQYIDDYNKKDDVLFKINKDLIKLPYTTNFPDYKPHSTIAYLKPGTSDKYVDMFKDETFIVNPTKIVYSEDNEDFTDRIKNEIKLNDK